MRAAAAEQAGTATRPLPPGLLPRLIWTWRAPGRVMQAQTGLRDAGLVIVLMLALVLILLAQLPVHNRAAMLDPAIPLNGRIAGAAIAVLTIMPVLAYLLAGIVSLLSFGRIDGYASRVALFWSLFAISPAMLLCGLAEGFTGHSPALRILQIATGLIFLWFWFSGLRTLREKR